MMSRVRAPMTVLQGGARERRRSPVQAAYEHFRLERQGNLVSSTTLQHYDDMVVPFLAWADDAGAHRPGDGRGPGRLNR